MGKQTSVTYDGQGNVVVRTTTTTQSGCSSGCGWVVTIIAALFLLSAPAQYFPLPLTVLAYIVEGLIVIAAIVAAMNRRAGRGSGTS